VHNNGIGGRGLAGLGLMLGGVGLLLYHAPAVDEATASVRAGCRLLDDVVTALGKTAAMWLGVLLLTLGSASVACWKHVPRVAGIRSGFAAIAATLFLTGAGLALDGTFGPITVTQAATPHHKQVCSKHKRRKHHKCRSVLPSKQTPTSQHPATPSGGSGGASGGTGGGSGGASGGTGGGSGGASGGTGGGSGGASGAGGGGGTVVVISKSNNQEASSGDVEGGGTSGDATNSNTETIYVA
jgi:hypothetical protein